MTDDPIAALRKRAYELADTGRHADWDAIAEELVGEDIPDILVRRLRHDALFQVMIKNRISAARGS